jgi:hypothetical protein
MRNDVLFESGGGAMKAALHVNEGVGATTIEGAAIVALSLPGVVAT